MSDLNGKSVLIVGGSSGIGLAVAKAAAAEGAQVTIASRSTQKLEAALPTADAMAGMDGKFWSAYRVARYAKISPDGSLTLTSGVRSQRPNASGMLQSAINSAVEGLGRGLSVELAPVRVNVISPGIIETPLFGGMAAADREAMFARLREGLPVRRLGQPEDVALAALSLMKNPYITGTTVVIDGGALMTMTI